MAGSLLAGAGAANGRHREANICTAVASKKGSTADIRSGQLRHQVLAPNTWKTVISITWAYLRSLEAGTNAGKLVR